MDKEIRMERRFFATNIDGESEFEWLLYQLGVPERLHAQIDEVVFNAENVKASDCGFTILWNDKEE